MRIGLDIDDTILDFWYQYCQFFDTKHHPEHLVDAQITVNVNTILKTKKQWWLDLPLINKPDFEPELYCTKRVIPKKWSRRYLEEHDIAVKPIYQLYRQEQNKADFIKGRVDFFVDDSITNFIQLNQAGIPCLLMDSCNNQSWGPVARVYSLNKDELLDCHDLFMRTMFPYFNELCLEYDLHR